MEIKTAIRMSQSILLSQVSFSLALFMDTFVFSQMGTEALAIWGIIQPYWLILFIFGNGCLMVLDRYFSEAFHQNNLEKLNHLLCVGMVLAAFLAVFLLILAWALPNFVELLSGLPLLLSLTATLLVWLPFFVLRQYLVSVEKLRHLNIVSIVGLMVHGFVLYAAPLNIYVVPLAHFLDRVVVLFMLLPTILQIKWQWGSNGQKTLLEFMQLGVPFALQLSARSLIFVILATWLTQFGAAVLATQSILTSLGNLLFIIPFSLSIVASILMARGHETRLLAKNMLLLGGGIMGAVILLVNIFASWLFSTMTVDQYVLALLGQTLPYLLLFIFIDSWQTIMTGVFRGNKETWQPFYLYAVCFFCLGLPLAIYGFANVLSPLLGLWLAMSLGSLLLGFILWQKFTLSFGRSNV